MTYADEATGVALAARDAGIPSVISFTVETDGRLPSGQALGEAIAQVDAETSSAPAYYMINCAHPTHFDDVLEGGGAWRSASAACGPTRRPRATPSSTRPPRWTRAIPGTWASATPRCGCSCPT